MKTFQLSALSEHWVLKFFDIIPRTKLKSFSTKKQVTLSAKSKKNIMKAKKLFQYANISMKELKNEYISGQISFIEINLAGFSRISLYS